MLYYLSVHNLSFKSQLIYRSDVFFRMLQVTIGMLVFGAIWLALYGDDKTVDGRSIEMVITYVLIGVGLFNATNQRGKNISQKVYSGAIALELVRPRNFILRTVFTELGVVSFSVACIFLPALIISSIVYGLIPPVSYLGGISFLISALLGCAILQALNTAVSLCAFWITKVWALDIVKTSLILILGGVGLPVWFYVDSLKEILVFLPFGRIIQDPMRIYLENLELIDISVILLVQVAWLLLISIFIYFTWSRGCKKVFVNGG